MFYHVRVEDTTTNNEGSVSTNKQVDGPFEHLAVCQVGNTTPTPFSIPGLEFFDGEITHKTDFRKANRKGIGELASLDDAFGIFGQACANQWNGLV